MASDTAIFAVELIRSKIAAFMDEDVVHMIIFHTKKDYDTVVKQDGLVNRFLGVYVRVPRTEEIPEDCVPIFVTCRETKLDEKVLFPRTLFLEPSSFQTVAFQSETVVGCWVCGAAKTQKCGMCKLGRYCSKECQKKGWPAHKEDCQKVYKK